MWVEDISKIASKAAYLFDSEASFTSLRPVIIALIIFFLSLLLLSKQNMMEKLCFTFVLALILKRSNDFQLKPQLAMP